MRPNRKVARASSRRASPEGRRPPPPQHKRKHEEPSRSRLVSTQISPTLLRSWPLPEPDGETGKDGRGAVLVVGGSEEIPGGTILAALAALRAGAGKLQIATSGGIASVVAVAVPEARVIGLRQGRKGELHAQSWRALREEMRRCDALLVGPGMGVSATPAAADLLRACVVAKSPKPALVVDAGALGAFDGRDRFARHCQAPVIATPHAGEMASLWGITREEVAADPLTIAVQAAAHLGVVMVLKGATTFVASPQGKVFCNTAGNSGLGTSGSGDTLSGIIAGLCARGADAVQAAVWGVYLHAKAGDVLASRFGGLGFLARELSPEIPRLMARLGRRRPA